MQKTKSNTLINQKAVPLWFRLLFYLRFSLFKALHILEKIAITRFISRVYYMVIIYFAKWEAKSMHALTGQQYYVLKFYGKVRVLSTKNINYLKKKRTINKKLDYYSLQQIAIYKTK